MVRPTVVTYFQCRGLIRHLHGTLGYSFFIIPGVKNSNPYNYYNIINQQLLRSYSNSCTYKAPYLKISSLTSFNNRYSNFEYLLHSQRERTRFLNGIQSPSSASGIQNYDIYATFLNSLDFSIAYDDQKALEFACDIWKAVTNPHSPHTLRLKKQFMWKRPTFINILLHKKAYDVYANLVLPLIPQNRLLSCDITARTLQLRRGPNDEPLHSTTSLRSYLKNVHISMFDKRSMVSDFVFLGMKSSPDVYKPQLLAYFLEYLRVIGDDHCLLVKPEHAMYKKGIRELLLAFQDSNIYQFLDEFSLIFLQQDFSRDDYCRFLTTLMKVSSEINPQLTHYIWRFKLGNKYHMDSSDLTYLMESMLNTNQSSELFSLYKHHPTLHHEHQLQILLKASELNKDWSYLQRQFEDMYGKGQLPYVIHYSVVMNALASLGGKADIERLYLQMSKRKLKPSSSIYAALIKCRIYLNEIKEAHVIFDSYLKNLAFIEDQDMSPAAIYKLILSTYLQSSNVNEVMKFYENTKSMQDTKQVNIIDSDFIKAILGCLEGNYALKQIEYIRSQATEMNLMSEDVYMALFKAYTHLGQYERVEDLVFYAHHVSSPPLMSCRIYTAQLRNYRFWYRYRSDPVIRRYIDTRRGYVLKTIEENQLKSRGKQGLYTEIIKFLLTRNMVDTAKTYLNQITSESIPKESIYSPFLKYYTKSSMVDDYRKVLETYRDMVEAKVSVSVKTYEMILKSLVVLDGHNRNNYVNSTNFLQSILDMYGLSLFGVKSSSTKANVSVQEIYNNMVPFCRMISTYVMETSISNADKGDIVVNFLKQIKDVLGDNLSNQFRFTIYSEMGKLYQRLGNVQMTESLISTGIKELNDIISKYIETYPFSSNDIIIPRQLQVEFRLLINLNLKILQQRGANPQEYYALIQLSHNNKVQLSGNQYNFLIEQLLQLNDFKGLSLIFDTCETYLVDGNFAEVEMMKKIQYLYHLFVFYHSRTTSDRDLLKRYNVLNNYYNVHDIKKLKNKFKSITNIQTKMTDTINDMNIKFKLQGQWSLEDIFDNPETFFSPEKRLSTTNKLFPTLCNRLWHYIMTYANDGHDKIKLFKLMDDYPFTMELLFYNQPANLRLKAFRNDINQIIPPSRDDFESFADRQNRSERALATIFNSNRL